MASFPAKIVFMYKLGGNKKIYKLINYLESYGLPSNQELFQELCHAITIQLEKETENVS